EAVAAGVMGSLASAAALLVHEHASFEAAAVWLLLFSASAIVSIQSSIAFRRIRAAEANELQQRVDAQSQLARSERRRAQAEKLAVVGQLATGVAHEIRNPLQLAMLQLDFLKTERMTDATRERVTQVNRALEKIAQIVNDLRGFAGGNDDSELEAVRVEEVLDETLRLADLRLKRVARVEQSLGGVIPRVRAQPRQLSQVLLNLLVNAADALEESHREDALIRVGVDQHDGNVRILVEDNGPGIPPEVMPRLFEPFFTTKGEGKGTGLGLALSREYVERFGGVLSAENREGGGARFIIDLPTEQPPEPAIKN
ncbi:MAG: sensor histidine kinase, partial [Myxococcaceae bacterium]